MQDNEELYRNVRGKLEDKEYSIQDENSELSITSFWDRSKKPSVDRAELKDFDPASALLCKTNGIVSIKASDVRAIGTVKTKHANEVIADHAVDVIPDPNPDNPAHAIIIVKPELFDSENKQKNAFNCYKSHWLNIYYKNGWTLEPSPQ